MNNQKRFSYGDRVSATVYTSDKSKTFEGNVSKVYADGSYEVTDDKGGACFVSPKEALRQLPNREGARKFFGYTKTEELVETNSGN